MRLVVVFLACLLLARKVSASPAEEFCGCTETCRNLVTAPMTCMSPSDPLTYTEKYPCQCLEHPECCNLIQVSGGYYIPAYSGQNVRLEFDQNVQCDVSAFATAYLANGSVAFNYTFTYETLSSCVLATEPLYNPDIERLFIALQDMIVVLGTAIFTISTAPPQIPPLFDVTFEPMGYLQQFTLAPLYGCCLDAPDTLTVTTIDSCSAVTFSLQGTGNYAQDAPFDTLCATTQEDAGAYTTYYYLVEILGDGSPPCQTTAISTSSYNISNTVLKTSAPTFTPTVQSNFSVTIGNLDVAPDPNLCPVSISGFGLPYVPLSVSSPTYQVSPVYTSIWFPPALWTVNAPNTLRSSACIAQTRDCIVRAMNASVRVEKTLSPTVRAVATDDAVFVGARVTCRPHAPCYPGESLNVNPIFPPSLVIDYPNPFYLGVQQIATLNVPSIARRPDLFVTFDTLSVTIEDLDTNMRWSQDISSKYKDIVMRNISYPEYFDGNFCRYNDSFFYIDPYRWNAYVAQNIETINATVCAFASIPWSDRVTFTPINWVLQAATCARCKITYQATGQIRTTGPATGVSETIANETQITLDQPGCVWVEKVVYVNGPNQVPTFTVASSVFVATNALAIIYLGFTLS